VTDDPQASPQEAAAHLDEVAGSSHHKLIAAQLAEERSAKTSIEQRGLGVITSAGVLTTLLFGLSAFALGARRIPIDFPERSLLILSLALFLGASALAASTALPSSFYREADVPPLELRVTRERWYSRDVIEAARLNARIEVAIIKAARSANEYKAKRLKYAVIVEVAALLSLAIAVGLTVARI
jgi:hypothetical protein